MDHSIEHYGMPDSFSTSVKEILKEKKIAIHGGRCEADTQPDKYIVLSNFGNEAHPVGLIPSPLKVS